MHTRRVAIRPGRETEAAQIVSHTPVEEPAEHDIEISEYSDVGDRLAGTAWARFRPLVIRLHFYAGIFLAPFILVAACTGCLRADPADRQRRQPPRTDCSARGRATPTPERPDLGGTPGSPRGNRRERPATGGAGADHPDHPGGRRRTARLRPDRVRRPVHRRGSRYVDHLGGSPRPAWFDEFHRNLHLGVVGRHYREFAASWLWVVVLAGLALWWHRTGAAGRSRRLLRPTATHAGRNGVRAWHAATGAWIARRLLLWRHRAHVVTVRRGVRRCASPSTAARRRWTPELSKRPHRDPSDRDGVTTSTVDETQAVDAAPINRGTRSRVPGV